MSYNKTNLKDYINSSIIKEESNENMPDFCWVVRDFFLSLDGLTPKQYLEDCLELKTEERLDPEQKKQTKYISDAIKNSFKSLDCFCLPLPVGSGKRGMSQPETLRKLEILDFGELEVEFLKGIKDLANKMKNCILPKIVNNIPLSAAAFSNYIETVVKLLNENKKVSFTDCLTSCIQFSSEKALKEAFQSYKTQMDDFLVKNTMPLKYEIIDNKNKEITDSCFKMLGKNLNGSNAFTKPVLDAFIEGICQYEKRGNNSKLSGGLFFEIRNNNRQAIMSFNKDVLNKLWYENISGKALGSENFIKALEKLKLSYDTKSFHGIEPEKSELYNEWLKEKDIDGMKNVSEQHKAELKKQQVDSDIMIREIRVSTDNIVAAAVAKSNTQQYSQTLSNLQDRNNKLQTQLDALTTRFDTSDNERKKLEKKNTELEDNLKKLKERGWWKRLWNKE